MQNEILKPVLEIDETAIPRYDIVNPDGSVAQQNIELRLKNEVMQQGTPYDEESVLPAQLATQLGLPTTATPAQALQLLATKSYSKDETLSNETKTLFGLNETAVPDDVLAFLGKYNQHWWRKRRYIHGTYDISSNKQLVKLVQGKASANTSTSIEYADSFSADTGLVSASSQSVWYNEYSRLNSYNGKYVHSSDIPGTYYFIPSDAPSATRGRDSDNTYYCEKQAQQITVNWGGYSEWEYIQSSDRNAYPDGGIKVIGYQLNVADPVSDTYVLVSSGSSAKQYQYEYSSNVNIDDSGNLSLVDPILITLTVEAYQDANVLKGKFYRNVTDSGAIKFMPSDAPDVTQISSSSEGQAIKGTVCAVTVETLYDDYEYQYLGVPFENAIIAPKIEVGSYVGTGTYGKANPNSLTFSKVPKLVLITGRVLSDGRITNALEDGVSMQYGINTDMLSTEYQNIGFGSGNDKGSSMAKKSEDCKTIFWYNSSSSADSASQCNVGGATYYYIAIC